MISHFRSRAILAAVLSASLSTVLLAGCGDSSAEEGHGAEDGHGHGEGEGEGHEEAEVGPNGGRLLKDGDFSAEVVVFEAGDEPRFRLFGYVDGRVIASGELAGTITTTRLGGRQETFSLQPHDGYLQSSETVGEPHSFDVSVNVTFGGAVHSWVYESHENRTEITAEAAAEAGVKVAAAGPSVIREKVELSGRVTLLPSGRAEVRAWYPGRVMSVKVNVGDRVAKGDPVATVEARDSLKVYTIEAPIAGVVMDRALNVGDVADQQAIVVIGDPTALQAELHVFPRDAERVRPGQDVVLRSLSGGLRAETKIGAFLPATEVATQTITARAPLPNPEEVWRAGMAVEGSVTVASSEVPVAVRASAIQQMSGTTVIFLQDGDDYQAQPVSTGRSDGEWVEITSGLEAGQVYVTENSFLIRADIEKSGAAHEH